MKTNIVYQKDNLKLLKEMPDNSIDLIYIDPPYNKGRTFTNDNTGASFSDSFNIKVVEKEWNIYRNGDIPLKLHNLLFTIKEVDKNRYAYCMFMTSRIVELHRVLKDTGSIYLHIDPKYISLFEVDNGCGVWCKEL